ncbi:MAG: hypothetical protein Q8P24_13100 [Desulfobacterales bacterium]|nr:hypothetical protein [Desulfobacterales bacterium]
MLIHDGIYAWKGWGGKLRLGSGTCRLRIFDLRKRESGPLDYLRPVIVIVSDIPENSMSVRSCAGHIATSVVKDFGVDPSRMLWVEYYPQKTYGVDKVHVIAERYELVDFVWHEQRAIQPRWRSVNPPILEVIQELIAVQAP